MDQKRMPVIFSGHGSPMVALEHSSITEGMAKTGDFVLENYGTPKGILAISAHWYAGGTYIQSSPEPRQVFDMYGFPDELYQVSYHVKGNAELTESVKSLLWDAVSVNNSWGIDHGTWTVLVHMFPKADIPVVQLSVNRNLTTQKIYELGKKLSALRDMGYLILGSGNTVHNLMRVEWENPNGTPMAVRFNEFINDAVLGGDIESILNYKNIPDASYAVPTPDHFLPLIYCLGAAEGDSVRVFNNVCNLGSMAMTGYLFESKE